MPRPASLPPALLDQIRRIEEPVRHGVLPFGVAALDAALPGGGLALGAVHEIMGTGGDEEDGAAAAGFAAGILARLDPFTVIPDPPVPAPHPNPLPAAAGRGRDPREAWEGEGTNENGPVLWCLQRHDLYGPGLLAH